MSSVVCSTSAYSRKMLAEEGELQVTQTLGDRLPVHEYHSVSVSLPKWSDVVGYEEGKEDIINRLTSGYPRFRMHDSVTVLFQLLKGMASLPHHTEKTDVVVDGSLSKKTAAFIYSQYPPNSLEWYVFPTLAIGRRFVHFLQQGVVLNDPSLHDTSPHKKEAGITLLQESIKLYQLLNTSCVAICFDESLTMHVSEIYSILLQ